MTGVELAQAITTLYRTKPNTQWLQFFRALGDASDIVHQMKAEVLLLHRRFIISRRRPLLTFALASFSVIVKSSGIFG